MAEILITGGAGFIGCALSARLAAAGHRVVAVDVLHPQVHPAQVRPPSLDDGVDLVVGDVTEPDLWPGVLDRIRPDVVVHLAAETGTGQSFSESTRHAHVNVVGTTVMLDALLAADAVPDRLVLASSRAVYGEGAWRGADGATFHPPARSRLPLEQARWDPLDASGGPATPLPARGEATLAAPTSIYGATKLAQEHVLGAWAAGTGASLSVLRFQNVYGPGQSVTNSYTGIVVLFARLAKEGSPIEVYEDGRIIRDFVYIDDVADALTASVAAEVPHGPLDIGSGRPTTILELATTLAEREGSPSPVISGAWRVGDIRAAWCDQGPAQAALGFTARWSLGDGLEALRAWVASG